MQFGLFRNLVSLSPKHIISDTLTSLGAKFAKVLQSFIDSRHITYVLSDKLLSQYQLLIPQLKASVTFCSFDESKNELNQIS